MHGCAPTTCSGWPFTTLASPPLLNTGVGRGGHGEGHGVMKYGGDGGLGVGDTGRKHPSLLLSHLRLFEKSKQTPDSRCQSLNLIQVGFRTSPASKIATSFFAESQLTNQMPLSASLLICMMLGASHNNIYTQVTKKTNI